MEYEIGISFNTTVKGEQTANLYMKGKYTGQLSHIQSFDTRVMLMENVYNPLQTIFSMRKHYMLLTQLS